MVDLKGIAEFLIAGDAQKVRELVQAAINEKVEPKKILDEGLISGMEVVGTKFKNCEIYVPELLLSARAMDAGMEILKPLLEKIGTKSKGVFFLGSSIGNHGKCGDFGTGPAGGGNSHEAGLTPKRRETHHALANIDKA